ncbi:hypothetical protein M595_0981 [Lyngbya aestuarii BL J]|uniref:Uncharacterized protein n=1 Tax=Lyngbya aestuarii BL J TaxID=1348334 RepID=U7QM53_9CYAN|nr:hypothetical protein M595_0981 [Lyngbya aestuarii BL J]
MRSGDRLLKASPQPNNTDIIRLQTFHCQIPQQIPIARVTLILTRLLYSESCNFW